MLVRLWETDFKVSELPRLERYAVEVSRPVLETRVGCRGVMFYHCGGRWITQTLWTNRSAIDALKHDPDYQKIVSGIVALGILGTRQRTQIFDLVDVKASSASDGQ